MEGAYQCSSALTTKKLLWKLQCQCPVCPSSEATGDWQEQTGKFLHEPSVILWIENAN
jgi:hypothetical protein